MPSALGCAGLWVDREKRMTSQTTPQTMSQTTLQTLSPTMQYPQLPQKIVAAHCKACWFIAGLCVLIGLSFYSLDLQWAAFLSPDAFGKIAKFMGELMHPDLSTGFVAKLLPAALETLAMSALGTLLAALLGLALALPASKTHAADPARWRSVTRLVLNALRSIPELVWAALLLISAGLGPFAGTLALALHTAGVLGRLFAEALENAAHGAAHNAAFALRVRGVGAFKVLCYATLPTVLPQLISYTLYRWENNIRAAAVLGVVGAGGLGQMLSFHMGLFQMAQTSSVLVAMIGLVVGVDALSDWARRRMAQ